MTDINQIVEKQRKFLPVARQERLHFAERHWRG